MKVLALLTLSMALLLTDFQVEEDLASLILKQANVAASFINDSVIVDIAEGDFTEAVLESVGEVFSDEGGAPPVVLSESDDAEDEVGVIDTVVVTVSSEEEGSDSSASSESSSDTSTEAQDQASESTPAGSSETGSQTTISAQNILNTLTGSQAITNLSESGSSGSGANVSGSKTREALLSRNITGITIPSVSKNNSSVDKKGIYSREDLALIVSAAVVTNPEIEDVFYSTNALSIVYRAQGRLLFALPIPYTASLDLRFNESSSKERVRASFPWYTFLMWTGVSKNVLREQIDTFITSAPEGQEYDKTAHVFNEVTELLESTRGFRGIQ